MHRGSRSAAARAAVDAVVTVLGSAFTCMLIAAAVDAPVQLRYAAACVGVLVPAVAALSVMRRSPRVSTSADRITLLRAVLAGACASIVVLSLGEALPLRSWALFAFGLPAVLLDAVDGRVARRSSSATPEGARLDMETDAAVLLILSIPLSLGLGPWVLAIGAMRYVFLAASWWRAALRHPLKFSQFRRVVAGIQGVVLVACVIPVLPRPIALVATSAALVLLVLSFAKDVVTLEWGPQPSPPRLPVRLE